MPSLLTLELLQSERSYVERQLDELKNDRFGTFRLLWEDRLKEVDSQISKLKLSTSAYASVAIIFQGSPVLGSSDIRLDFATHVLTDYQKVVTLNLASMGQKSLPRRGPLPDAEASKLYIRDLARGSVGFILEEAPSNQTELIRTKLKDAVEGVTKLIQSFKENDEVDFSATLLASDQRVVAAVRMLIVHLRDWSATAEIIGDDHRVSLGSTDIVSLADRLLEVAFEDEDVVLTGRLLGFLPEARMFEFHSDDEQHGIIRGSVSDEFAVQLFLEEKLLNFYLLADATASFSRSVTLRRGKIVGAQWTLNAVSPK